ncbi:type III pantothenate kinase [Endothiovibrio diazotrophicus]
MILVVDAGNSGVKWGLIRGSNKIQRGQTVPRSEGRFAETVGAVWSVIDPPDRVVVANVTGPAFVEGLSGWVKSLWGLEAEFVESAAAACGVTNGYREPERLGVDRWVALIGAHERVKGPCCVVDCGTAITIDAIDGDGNHLGGLIIPGIELMRRALFEGTAGVDECEGGQASLLAADTAGAVNGGTLYTAVAVIDRVTADVAAELGGRIGRVITGGGARQLLPLLAGEYLHEPDLVLQGLSVIAQGPSRTE